MFYPLKGLCKGDTVVTMCEAEYDEDWSVELEWTLWGAGDDVELCVRFCVIGIDASSSDDEDTSGDGGWCFSDCDSLELC